MGKRTRREGTLKSQIRRELARRRVTKRRRGGRMALKRARKMERVRKMERARIGRMAPRKTTRNRKD